MQIVPESVEVKRTATSLEVTVDVRMITSVSVDAATLEAMPAVLAAAFRAEVLRAVDDGLLGTIKSECLESLGGAVVNKFGHVDVSRQVPPKRGAKKKAK